MATQQHIDIPATPAITSARPLCDSLSRFDASVTQDQVKTLGAPDQFGVERRLMLLVLSRNSEELVESFSKAENEDVFFEMINSIDRLKDFATAMAELCDSAIARLLLVGESTMNCDDQRSEEKVPAAA